MTDAVDLMLAKGLERQPVVDDQGRVKGMINRDFPLRTGYGNPPRKRRQEVSKSLRLPISR